MQKLSETHAPGGTELNAPIVGQSAVGLLPWCSNSTIWLGGYLRLIILTMFPRGMSKPHYLLRTQPLSPTHQWVFSQIRLIQGPAWFFTTICYHSRTLLLFTYTDFKTIVIPVVSHYRTEPVTTIEIPRRPQAIFAAVTAPVHSSYHFFQALLWIWLHLLQCNVSNQYKTCQEDTINRPWRPIPSGRVSLGDAYRLRLLLIPLCLSISGTHGGEVLATSAGLTTTSIVHDELGLAGHWVGKNLCNMLAYLTFEIGATKIMGTLLRIV